VPDAWDCLAKEQLGGLLSRLCGDVNRVVNLGWRLQPITEQRVSRPFRASDFGGLLQGGLCYG